MTTVINDERVVQIGPMIWVNPEYVVDIRPWLNGDGEVIGAQVITASQRRGVLHVLTSVQEVADLVNRMRFWSDADTVDAEEAASGGANETAI